MTTDTKAPSLREALEQLQAWCDSQCARLGAVDGYNYHSGEEAAYRHVAIEIKKRLAVLATPPAPTPSAGRIAKIVRDQLLQLDIGCGEDCNMHDAIAHLRGDADVGDAVILIADVSAWIADAILALLPDAAAINAKDAEIRTLRMALEDATTGITAATVEAAIRAAAFEPTDAQINSACLSFRHDYGLLDDHDRERLRFVAIEWLRAWQKEGFGCDRDEVIERCAAVVDQCNREGPYEAIASAKRIRALKSAAIRAAGEK
jgi:hypothetical protein